MSTQVRKFKVIQKGGIITKYFWQKTFLFFGRWVPYHNVASSLDNANSFINEIEEFIKSIKK